MTGRRRVSLRWAALVSLGILLLMMVPSARRATLIDPPATLLLRDRHGTFLGEVGDPSADGYGYWPVEALPARVVAATIALEDGRFYEHPGVDPLAVARAVRQNVAAKSTISGASTLAMQVARMQDPGSRTFGKKAVEAGTALFLTARYGRDAILAQYLRLAPYGNNIHGIAYAARRYLDKPVADLSWAETAFLCALPQAPSRTNPFDPKGRERAVARARRILDALFARGLLSADEVVLARHELANLRVPDKGRRPDEALHVVLRLGETVTDRSDPLVDTSLDLPLQGRVTDLVNDALVQWADRGAKNAAVMVVDRATWEVRAAVGSADYHDEAHAGAIDFTRTPRSPGSTLKPFFYALALDRGVITPGTVLDDLGRAADAIENADGAALGPMLPRQALANSRNVPAVEVLRREGLEEGYALLRDLGLHHDERSSSHFGLGLAIGGLPVRLDDLVGAYTALAGDGRVRRLNWRTDAATLPGRRAFSASTAQLLGLMLSDPMARLPSFPRMGATEYPFPVAVKTGTSSDYRDAWTVAWSSRYLVGAWVGDPTATPMVHLGGFSTAAALVRSVLVDLHRDEADGFADHAFSAPGGFVGARVCPLTGLLAQAACPRAVTEWFPPGTQPADPCAAHVRLAVDTRDGTLATAATPRAYTRIQAFVDLPPRFAAWQARVGLPRPPTSGAAVTKDATVRVTAPRDGTHIVRDPEAPDGVTSLALEAVVDPPSAQVLWVVDGEPYAVADAPYSARWPATPGEHTFEARLPYTPTGSRAVKITVR